MNRPTEISVSRHSSVGFASDPWIHTVLILRLSELITAYRRAGKVVCGLCLQCVVCFATVVCPVRSHAEDAWRPPILTADQQKTLDDFWQQQIRLGNSSIWLGQSDYKGFVEDGALSDTGFGISL